MLTNPQIKYQRFTIEPFPTRAWCNNQLTTAPRWCSSDLRDGNQALINPMDTDKKLYLFNHLVAIGFKEIEVAFPSASETDFNFVRQLINDKLIPNDVWIQVITQSRPELIAKTFDALQGASKAIVHLYNATAPVFREVVFNQDKASTIELAVNGAKLVKQHCEQNPNTQWQFEYSPETFCFTEREFALEICEAVKDVWQPTAKRPMIINLPATVEMNTPNVYADQIEWFMQNFSDLSHITISIHPHNDRGTGVACAELAMLAGATRVEGCLFGNGERTGNVDLVTLALNLYTQGIYPNLDFSNLQQTANVMTYCNGCRFIHDIRMPVNSYLLPLVALTKMRLKRVSLNVKKIQTVFGMCRILPLTLKTLVQPTKQSYGSIANLVKVVQHGCLKPIMASNYPVRFS